MRAPAVMKDGFLLGVAVAVEVDEEAETVPS